MATMPSTNSTHLYTRLALMKIEDVYEKVWQHLIASINDLIKNIIDADYLAESIHTRSKTSSA